jgi:hypothetical protein
LGQPDPDAAVRTHPVVGVFFLLVGAALVLLGALAGSYVPGFLRGLPLPPEIVIPLLLWQLATWAILFGFFFLRPRVRRGRHATRVTPRV